MYVIWGVYLLWYIIKYDVKGIILIIFRRVYLFVLKMILRLCFFLILKVSNENLMKFGFWMILIVEVKLILSWVL